ncbi:MAG: hypothetical protein J6Z43_05810 [Clostridiales bacterium]|nr:hypothetical protein [Clostridiales bacterium]
MIDGKNLKDLPFEAEGGAGLYGHKPHVRHVRQPRYMSTRSSVFLALTVSGLDLALMSEVPLYLPFILALEMILFWCFTLRFLRTSWAAPAVAFLMMCPAFAFGYFFRSVLLAGSMSVVALGLGCMSGLNLDDAEEDVRPAVWKEVLIPFLFASAASAVSYFGGFLFEKRYLFVSNIIAVSFLILTSIFISKTSGSRYFFTSKRLTEFWDIPVAEFSQLKIFISAKLRYLITLLWCFAAVYAIWFFVPFSWKNYLFMPAATLSVLPFIYLMPMKGRHAESLFGTRYFMFESYISSIMSSMFFTVRPETLSISRIIYVFLLFVGTDIIGSALLAVIRRRQIFVSRSKYIDGTPFMLTMFSLLIMLVEISIGQ